MVLGGLEAWFGGFLFSVCLRYNHRRTPRLQEAGIAIPKWLHKRWCKCPLRGRRVHELQDFMRAWEDRSLPLAAQVMVSLPGEISMQNRTILVQEYEAGRVWLKFYLLIKLSYLAHPPHSLFQLAHHSPAARCRTFQVALHSDQRRHPIMQMFQDPHIRAVVQRYLDGEHGPAIWSFFSFNRKTTSLLCRCPQQPPHVISSPILLRICGWCFGLTLGG